ncbi:hypothetical protein [Comamonas testosteroni]|uniref:hypothetical protein n=1 Tax=Comamonas testosteroni TaxID=285 RepID=UPI0012D36F78|nr:hypothetical protein [Comamonas testosteroni]
MSDTRPGIEIIRPALLAGSGPSIEEVKTALREGAGSLTQQWAADLIDQFQKRVADQESLAATTTNRATAPINPSEAMQLIVDSEFAIRALREYIQALPDEVVASLPAMPGIDGDWLDVLQANLKTAIVA